MVVASHLFKDTVSVILAIFQGATNLIVVKMRIRLRALTHWVRALSALGQLTCNVYIHRRLFVVVCY